MLYFLSIFFKKYYSFLNIFHYVSFRALGSLLMVLATSILLGEHCIRLAQRLFRSQTREYVPDGHRVKQGLPTMGGIFIVGVVIGAVLIWCNIFDPHVWIGILCITLFACIGFIDDRSKIIHKKGISERHKFGAQLVAAALVIGLWMIWCQPENTILIPFLKGYTITVPLPLMCIWWMLVIVGTSNAVNLTDGLDGLAIGSLLPNFATYALIAYIMGHAGFAQYLHLPYLATSELAIMSSILVGASLGFLWFNAYPAQIFMGDVGSLSLGAILGLIAIMTKQELLLLISGSLFVVEAVSVIVQVISFKLRGKRIFHMAPIHHHFELLGWPESKITARFGILSCIACLLALMLLKIR